MLARVTDKTVKKIVQDLHVKDKKKPGPKPKIGNRETRRISRAISKIEASGARVTAPKIQRECNLQAVHVKTAQRQLKTMDQTYADACS